jgi:ribosomal protein S27AE
MVSKNIKIYKKHTEQFESNKLIEEINFVKYLPRPLCIKCGKIITTQGQRWHCLICKVVIFKIKDLIFQHIFLFCKII